MATHGDWRRAGSGLPARRHGQGVQIQELPERVQRVFTHFKYGYVAADSALDLPDAAAQYLLNVRVDDKDRLVRMPGLLVVEELSRTPGAIATFAGLDGDTELVMFDPPYIGVRGSSLSTTWSDQSLPAGARWVTSLHGDRLIFTNGDTTVYAKEFGTTTVESLGWGPAKSLASFAGRIFAGAATIGGVFNPLGVMWSGATGAYNDVSGLGSGYELLLDDVAEGDEIVALRTLGFDSMAVLMKKSIWLARRTGDPYRPADFSPRVPGVGCAAEATARKTPLGVIFLSYSGVELFDGNSVRHLSGMIDGDLLPIDPTGIEDSWAVYSAVDNEYKICTPNGTWVYSLKYDRWTFCSLLSVKMVSLYSPSTEDPSSVLAGWGEYWNGYWDGPPTGEPFQPYKDVVYLQGANLAVDSAESQAYFDSPQTAVWYQPLETGDMDDRLVMVRQIELWYQGSGEVDIYMQHSSSGDWVHKMTVTLEEKTNVGLRRVHCNLATKHLGLQIDFKDSTVKFSRVKLTGTRMASRVTP